MSLKKAQVCEGSSKPTELTTTTSRNGKRPYVGLEEENEQVDDDKPLTLREAGKKVSSVQDRSLISFFLSDPDFLDCPICFRPFTNQVFQCKKGHVACSYCCKKLKKKCATCSSPIGSIRNRALEKVIESIKFSCPNAKYGCNKDRLSYSEKCGHESRCLYVPCTCPYIDCEFVSSMFDLPVHFGSEHGSTTVVEFLYDEPFNITLNSENEATMLQEEVAGQLFILQNLVTSLGNAVNICCITANSKAAFSCKISAKSNGCWGLSVLRRKFSSLLLALVFRQSSC